MVLKQNTYDIGDNIVPNITNTASSGDAITINAATGTPTHICLTSAGINVGGWSGVTNQGCRFTGAVGDVQQHQYTQTAAGTMQAGIALRINSASPPTTNAWCIARWRNSGGNALKLMLSTTNAIQLQNATGTGIKNFNSNVAPADGWYYADVQLQKGTTTTDGQATVTVYNMSTGAILDTYTATNINTGTADLTTMQWGKTESAGGGTLDIKYPRFNTGTNAALGMPTPPASSYTLLKSINFENGTNGTAVSTTVPSAGSGQAAFDLVQSNSQINRLGNASVVNGTLSLEMEQLAGSTNQINNYINLGATYSDIGITTMIRFSKAPTNTFVFLRMFADTTYTSTEVNCSLPSTLKPTLGENGQATINSANALVANIWYCMQVRYKAGTNNFTMIFYSRGTNTVIASMTGTLSSAVPVGSLRFGIGSTIDTGNIRVTMDDFQVASNGLPDRTDIGNIPPIVNSLSASKTLAEAGGTVAFTADATDPDGSVADAIWGITATNGVTPPTLNNQTIVAAQVYCRAALVDHSYTVTYIPVDDQGVQGEQASVVVNVNKATEILCTAPGVYTPLVWYVAQ